ncbi:MAG: fused MFS/spermidine synthase [Deltaproteobacteria bacterium]|nr:fused MFS/spermidine synthase [Deltaproteobacteria bacterium]
MYVCCFLSGAAALCYEVTWAKILSHTFGSTLGATAAVVGGFLGGMGVGAWAYYRARDRVGHPLLLYSILEFGIAATAIAATLIFNVLPDAFASVAFALPDGLALTLMRFAMTFLILLVPAALMGATFPALCTLLIDSRAGVDRHLGALYGVNTVGAALGALVAGLVLIESFGLRGTALFGVGVNVAIGIVTLLWRRSTVAHARGDELSTSSEPAVTTDLSPALTGSVLLFSGFATLAYEILWFRGLQHLFGNSTYALTIMLVIFLLGLGFGAQLLGLASRMRHPTRNLALCQLGIGLFAVVAIGLQSQVMNDRSTDSLGYQLSEFGSFYSAHWMLRLAATGLAAMVMMLPATLLMGLSFPMASRLFLSDVRHLGERVGWAVLLSNLGSILGSVLAALWILPAVGVVRGTQVVALVNFGLAAALLARSRVSLPQRLALVFVPAATAAALVAVFPSHSTPWTIGGKRLDGMRVVFLEEGSLATVSVQAYDGQPDRTSMAIDGVQIGVAANVAGRFAVYQKQFEVAHLPVTLDSRARHVLSIGLGSGATHAALLGYPHLETVTCVEINGGVIRGSQLFEYASAQDDPRSRVVLDDALHFLRTHRRLYDVIISDGKQADDFSGNAKLLALEFYELALSRLEPDGIFVQWIPTSLESEAFRSVMRAAVTAFPELEVFFDLPGAAFIVGSREPLAGRPHMVDADIAGLPARSELENISIPDLDALWARWLASKGQLQVVLDDGPISTWDRSPVEFLPYRRHGGKRAQRSMQENLDLLMKANKLGVSEFALELVPRDSPRVRVMSELRESMLLSLDGLPSFANQRAIQLLEEYPDDPMVKRWVRKPGSRPPS